MRIRDLYLRRIIGSRIADLGIATLTMLFATVTEITVVRHVYGVGNVTLNVVKGVNLFAYYGF